MHLKQEFADKIAELQKENKKLKGKINYLSGKMAENQLETRHVLSLTDLSLGGFTDEANDYCLKHGITMADKIEDL